MPGAQTTQFRFVPPRGSTASPPTAPQTFYSGSEMENVSPGTNLLRSNSHSRNTSYGSPRGVLIQNRRRTPSAGTRQLAPDRITLFYAGYRVFDSECSSPIFSPREKTSPH